MQHPCPRCNRVREIERGAENNICGECVRAKEIARCNEINERIKNGGAQMVPKCGYPYYSSAMGVLPSQQKEFREFSERSGVPMEFDNKGRVKVENARHRKQLMKMRKMVDFDSYC